MLKFSKIIFFLLFFYFLAFSVGFAYVLGFKSFDNTLATALKIDVENKLDTPIISIIWNGNGLDNTDQFWSEYEAFSGAMKNKILHITLGPDHLTAKQVSEGKFDDSYIDFFKKIKKYNIKVIFRTMHEMNGGRYPRSSNPYWFKQAWIHVYNLSRTVGLDKNNILFDRSVNHRDMPTADLLPSQKSTLYRCDTKNSKKFYCPIMEDYYPGDNYVDLVGFTFYNRGKASYNRKRLTAEQILNDDNFLLRIIKLNKPVMIDEFATTAVYYKENYNQKQSQLAYKNDLDKKNARLKDASMYLSKQKNIIGAIYFNIDYTNGLSEWIIGEADRAIINISNKKLYNGLRDLYTNSQSVTSLYYMFATGSSGLALISNTHGL